MGASSQKLEAVLFKPSAFVRHPPAGDKQRQREPQAPPERQSEVHDQAQHHEEQPEDFALHDEPEYALSRNSSSKQKPVVVRISKNLSLCALFERRATIPEIELAYKFLRVPWAGLEVECIY
jgi:hypothetical protein